MPSTSDTLHTWLQTRRPLLAMFDYDGTLTPIAARPELAQIDTAGLAFIKQLMMTPQVHVAVVSGRSVEQLRGFLGTLENQPLLLAGLHGGEIYDCQHQHWLLQADGNSIETTRALHAYLEQAFAARKLEGLLIEDKGHSLALHFRQAEEATAQQALTIFHDWIAAHPNETKNFRTQAGKRVEELLPKHFNKGKAVEALSALIQERHGYSPPPEGLSLLYAGDDLTDETAFEAVNARGGLSVRVGEDVRETAAQIQVRDLYQAFSLQ